MVSSSTTKCTEPATNSDALPSLSVAGFRRNFSLKDDGIQYPYAVHERVPSWLLFVISLAAPFGIMPIINLLSVRSLWDWHNSTLGLILAWGLTGTFTNIVKASTPLEKRVSHLDIC